MPDIIETVKKIDATETGTILASLFLWLKYHEIVVKNGSLTVYVSLRHLLLWLLFFGMRRAVIECCEAMGIKQVRVRWKYFLEQ